MTKNMSSLIIKSKQVYDKIKKIKLKFNKIKC